MKKYIFTLLLATVFIAGCPKNEILSNVVF